MTKIRIKHNSKRYLLTIENGQVELKKQWLLFKWSAKTEEREIVSRVFAKSLTQLWPQALKNEVYLSIDQSK